jgi:mannose-P-dolichol utilization defect protein 1
MQSIYPQFIEACRKLIGASCTKQLIEKRNWKNVECLKIAASKGLGLGIVLGASLVKIPQILKILLAGSAEGVSFLSQFLELIAASINFAYNAKAGNPFTTYGETLMISIQNAIIVALIGIYNSQMISTLLISVVYAVLMTALLSPQSWFGLKELGYLHMSSIPLIALSRLPQIWKLLSERKIGQLSPITVWLMALGSLARVYTCWQEVRGDKTVLAASVVCAGLNFLTAFIVVLICSGAIKAKPTRFKKIQYKRIETRRTKKKVA